MTEQKWEGIDDALKAIDSLGPLAGREVSVKALTDAGRPIKEDIERLLASHRFTGALEADISIGESREAAGQGEVAVLIGAKRQAYKLRWLEFGAPGHSQRATPVIRPAWDAAAPTYLARVMDGYRRAYKSVVRRYTRKAAA